MNKTTNIIFIGMGEGVRLFLIVILLAISNLQALDKWYIRGGAGINYLTLPIDEALELDVEMDTGLYSFLSVGHQFTPNLRAELEAAYRINEGYIILNSVFTSPLEGGIECYSGMLNLMLDFPFQEVFVLSLGAGTGLEKTHGHLKTDWQMSGQKTSVQPKEFYSRGLCGQGIVGLMIVVSPKICLGGDYRFWSCLEFSQNGSLAGFLTVSF